MYQTGDSFPIHDAPLRTAGAEHVAALHPVTSTGRVSIAHATPDGWRERSYRLDRLPYVVAYLAGGQDWYISQQRFFGTRAIANLLQLVAMWQDLDYHKVPELAGMHPMGVLEDVLIALERAQMPSPTLAIFSGRGLYPIWLHEPVPRMVLPRWNACQRELHKVLKRFGADRGALDAARVLRIAGTINSKSGAVVEQIAPPGEVYDFETLVSEILPLERDKVRDLQIQRALRRPSEPLWTPPQGFDAATLWAGRLGDLQRLSGVRYPTDDLPPGERDIWMFLAGVAMGWMAASPQVLERELLVLARSAAQWSEPEACSRLQAIFKRAEMAARGEKIEWPIGSGRMVDPRYRFKNETIIEWLEITPDEMEDLDVIIDGDERRRRDRRRKEQERRAAGVRSRFEIAAHNRREVADRTARGESVREISEALRLSKDRVKQIRRELKNVDAHSVDAGGQQQNRTSGKQGYATIQPEVHYTPLESPIHKPFSPRPQRWQIVEMERLVARRYGGDYWTAWQRFESEYGVEINPTIMSFDEVEMLIEWLMRAA